MARGGGGHEQPGETRFRNTVFGQTGSPQNATQTLPGIEIHGPMGANVGG